MSPSKAQVRSSVPPQALRAKATNTIRARNAFIAAFFRPGNSATWLVLKGVPCSSPIELGRAREPAFLAIWPSRPVDERGREADGRAERHDWHDADPDAPSCDERGGGERDHEPVRLTIREGGVAGDEDRQSCDDADDADRDAVEPGCERAGLCGSGR
jgi:hypothetical protein